jgi:hypothetical protein
VLRNGKIVTLDPARPEGSALAARAGRIVAVGEVGEIDRLVGAGTRVIDLEGRLAIPGFIEGHGHLVKLGLLRMNLDLAGTTSWREIVERVRAAAREAKPGEWITGRGWHQEKWTDRPEPAVEGFPTHRALSEAAPENPVYLRHASGHAAIANQKAMEIAGIGPATADPQGGEILREPTGAPSGVFRENAAALIGEAYERGRSERPAEEVEAETRRAIDLAVGECLSKGITSFHDAGVGLSTIALYRELAVEGRLPVRIYAMISAEEAGLRPAQLAAHKVFGFADEYLTVRAIKSYMDGALGSRGAWLLGPYADSPGSTGMATTPLEAQASMARLAAESGFQLATHAIGDRGVRETLDIYERTLAGVRDGRERRWRIEHAQHVDPSDVPRFARLGVIAAVQGVHCTSDGPWVPRRIGEDRARVGAYPWRSFLTAGVLLVNGTDVPVEDIDPIACFDSSVTRRLPDGSAFHPEQSMSREEALASYTRNAAYAAFEEALKGTLSPGKLADIVVLSRDILTIPPSEIAGTRALYTIVGGKVLYERDTTDVR